MVLPIFTYGTRVLRAKAKPVNKVDEPLIKLVMDMFDTMHTASGIGLAANQVGALQRVIVVDISDIEENKESEYKDSAPPVKSRVQDPPRAGQEDNESARAFKSHPPITLINPEVVSSEGHWTFEEGCLSIPHVRDSVERAETITIRYKDTNFHDVELKADGLLARVILHEIDHLNGVLFVDHISAEKRKVHKEQLKKIQRGDIDVDYAVVTAASQKMAIASSKGG